MDPVRKIDARLIAGNWVSFAFAIGASLPWTITAWSGNHPSAPVVAAMAGLSVLGAAFVLSWVVDAAELDLPPALAVSLLALIAVLPEYAVDATFAWNAAEDPTQAPYAIANMTGGNRLLLGLGWSTLVFLSWMRFGKPAVPSLRPGAQTWPFSWPPASMRWSWSSGGLWGSWIQASW